MPDYKKMYFILFDAVTTAIDQLQNAQLEGENAYIESDDPPLAILPKRVDERPETNGKNRWPPIL